MIQVLEDSRWVKHALYATFAVACGVLVLKSSAATSFTPEPMKGALFGFVIAVTAVVVFQVSLQTSCRRNSRVLLVLGGLLAHLVRIRIALRLAPKVKLLPCIAVDREAVKGVLLELLYSILSEMDEGGN